MSNLDQLWSPLAIGPVHLDNRGALAPMTRISATEEGHVIDQMVAYYGAFASGGFDLLITEGNYPDAAYGQGYLLQSGLATEDQARSWSAVVEAVHAAGAKIFAQLIHADAQAQSNRFVDATIGPSAVAPWGSSWVCTVERVRILCLRS